MHLTQALNDCFADNMIWQTGKRLSTDNVWCTCFNEVAHLCGKQPTLAHRVTKRKNLTSLLGQFINVRIRLKALGLLQHLIDWRAQTLNHLDSCDMCHAALERGA